MPNRPYRFLSLLMLLSSSWLLNGCIGNAPRPAAAAIYDFGGVGEAPAAWRSTVTIGALDVRSSSWLDGVSQLYRLNYEDAMRRHAYAESRWAAPPGELLERQLRRQIVYARNGNAGAGCRLRLSLDEFEQHFVSAAESQAVLAVSASLLPPKGETALARQVFLIKRPAPTADAQGGAQAARQAVDELVTELSGWLDERARKKPQIVAGCKGQS